MASEADFPFAELEQEFNKNLVQEFNGLAEQRDQVQRVILQPRGKMDPFYQAQVFAKDFDLVDPEPLEGSVGSYLTPDMPVREILGQSAVEQLNSRYAGDVIQRRLTISARRLQLLRADGKPDWWDEDAVVSGVFDRFDFANRFGQSTLFVLLDDPYFIDPNYIQEDYAKKIHVPVLGIDDWRMDSRL